MPLAQEKISVRVNLSDCMVWWKIKILPVFYLQQNLADNPVHVFSEDLYEKLAYYEESLAMVSLVANNIYDDYPNSERSYYDR